MPAPTGIELVGLFKKNFAGTTSPELEAYVSDIADAVSQAWEKWQKGLNFGALTVTGAGIGAWSGSGGGGAMSERAEFELPTISHESKSEEQEIFIDALRTSLTPPFTSWAASFKFSPGAAYIGTCGATPVSPGPVNASLTPPLPLSVAGNGKNPAMIGDTWAGQLSPPKFDISSPQAKTKDLIDAISAMIEEGFETLWLTKALASGNTFFFAAATPGAGVASGPSNNDGTIV